MCTVTYIPFRNKFIFTSNRDESPLRSANKIEQDGNLYFPRDPKAKGTWFVLDEGKRLRCLLNGAFVKHHHRPPYRLSRGVLVLDSMAYSDLKTFSSTYDFTDIEPFTFIEVQFQNNLSLCEMRWDGEEVFYNDFNPEIPRIWSSSPLYSLEKQMLRKTWFEEFMLNNDVSPESLFKLHESKISSDDTINFMMKMDPGPRTISTTQYDHINGKLIHKNQLTNEIMEMIPSH